MNETNSRDNRFLELLTLVFVALMMILLYVQILLF
jgi:hypothetical protein